jgi:hypothetical protein
MDYRHRTVNLYFDALSPETLEPDSVRSILRDLELPEPSERLLTLSRRAFGFYATLGWDSPKIERSAFSILIKDPADLPVPVEPEIEKFLASMRRRAADDKFLYYVAMSSTARRSTSSSRTTSSSRG